MIQMRIEFSHIPRRIDRRRSPHDGDTLVLPQSLRKRQGNTENRRTSARTGY